MKSLTEAQLRELLEKACELGHNCAVEQMQEFRLTGKAKFLNKMEQDHIKLKHEVFTKMISEV